MQTTAGSVRRARAQRSGRRGAVAVLAAFFLVVMLAFVAFSVDLGYVAQVNTELQRASDAGALAGAKALTDGNANALAAVQQYVALNPVAGRALPADNIVVDLGVWDTNSLSFSVNSQTPSAVRVTLNDPSEALFFGRVLNKSSMNLSAQTVAMHQPRDIVLALDFSGSMCDDSQFGAISKLGLTYIQNNFQTMYNELGSPVYGSLTFTPQYATITGMAPTNGNMAQITSQFKDSAVMVTSTKSITQVKLQFADGSTQTVSASGTSGTFKGTGSNASKQVSTAWVKSGTNDSGNPTGSGERFADDATTLKKVLGLTNVPYPYSGDTWDNYFNYVKTDSAVDSAGYAKMYGYMTWINYLQASRQAYSQTPDLWKTSEQPVKALKDSVSSFIGYLQGSPSDDRVGLSIYTYTDQTSTLESGLTADFGSVSSIVQHRQAGHYTGNTNISAGMQKARLELQNNGRVNAFKMMILMTDGVANLPGNATNAKSQVISEANLAAAAKIKVVCIGLGAGADTALLTQVSTITGGVTFSIAGGQSVGQVQQQLQDVFKTVVDNRPLKLVQ
jgi:Flp pilus assembly protein TadG